MRRRRGVHHAWIPFTDTMAGILGIMLVVAILLLAYVSPTAKNKDESAKSPGLLSFAIAWKEPSDVDMWVKTPGEDPVGYNHRQSTTSDLIRDDRGNESEAMGGLHFENVFVRKAIPGEYIFNVHLYSTPPLNGPIVVSYEVVRAPNPSVVGNVGGVPTIIKKGTVHLDRPQQEVTVLRFKLDEKGEIVWDSRNDTPISIRMGNR